MTKKELRWRFKNLPTVNEVTELMANKIITPDEARDLLFNEGEPDKTSDREKELQKQIEFLEDLVRELSKNRNTVISWPVYIEKYIERWPRPNYIWCGTTTGTFTAGYNNIQSNSGLSNYAQNLLS